MRAFQADRAVCRHRRPCALQAVQAWHREGPFEVGCMCCLSSNHRRDGDLDADADLTTPLPSHRNPRALARLGGDGAVVVAGVWPRGLRRVEVHDMSVFCGMEGLSKH